MLNLQWKTISHSHLHIGVITSETGVWALFRVSGESRGNESLPQGEVS